MMMRWDTTSRWLVLTLIACCGVRADDVPLPDGAIARLKNSTLRHGDGVRDFTFTADGSTLVSCSSIHDGTLRAWDVGTGRELRRIPCRQATLVSVALSSDGKHVASAGGGSFPLRIWDISTGKMVSQHALDPRWVKIYSVAYSPDGNWLVTGNTNATITVWDAETLSQSKTLTARGDAGVRLTFSPDGASLLTWSPLSERLRMWDAQAWSQRYALDQEHITAPGAFSPDNSTIASGCRDGSVRLWGADQGEEVGTFYGHAQKVLSVAFTTDGQHLITSSEDQTIRVWNIESREQVNSIELERPAWIALSPDGDTLAARFEPNSMIRTWTFPALEARHVAHEEDETWRGISFDAEGKRLLAIQPERIELWDIESRKELKRFKAVRSISDAVFSKSEDQIVTRTCRALNPAVYESSIRRRSIDSGESLKGFRESVGGGVLSSSGEWAALWGRQSPIRLMRTDGEGTEIQLDPNAGSRNLIGAFTRDDERFAVALLDGTLRTWSVETGEELATIDSHIQKPRAFAVSPRGDIYAVTHRPATGKGGVIHLFHQETGASVGTLEGHQDEILAMAFGPQGRRIASVSLDGTLRVWHIAEQKEIGRYAEVGNTPFCVAFVPDGKTIITGMSGADALIWKAPDA